MEAHTRPRPIERHLRFADGRRTTLLDLGAEDGEVIIGLHGTPGSRLRFRKANEAALELGVRVIAPDRWAYGGTDAPKHPSLDSYANDLEAIADALSIDRFSLLGISGGGPYAAVAAGLLAHRVRRTALVCPVGLTGGTGPFQGSAFHGFCFRILPRLPGMLRMIFAAYRALALRMPDAAVRMAISRAPASDLAIMANPDNRRYLAEAFVEGFRPGSSGPVIDMKLFGRDWRPAPAAPGSARIWIGTHDQNVPLGAARALAAAMTAELTEVQAGGHYWIGQSWPEILQWLSSPDD